jgi:uncharacterized protein YjbI with pentapeptide repeats
MLEVDLRERKMTFDDIWMMFRGVLAWFAGDWAWFAAMAAVAVIAWLVFYYPLRIFPPSRSSRREEIVADLKARNIVRTIIGLVLAGFGFVAIFIQSGINFNRDLRQRTDVALTQAIEHLGSREQTPWQTIGSLLLLAKIADQDATYHKLVYSTMAEYLASPDRCRAEADRHADYVISPNHNVAAQIFSDRNLAREPLFGRLYNLEGVCLSKAALFQAKGFRRAWMPQARLFRVDLREADLREADLRGARAGVIYIDEWESMKKEYGSNPIGELIKRNDPYRLSRLWADFSGADFSSASLDGAHLEGANFEKATFVRALMRGTTLDMARLKNADFSSAVLTGAHFNQADLEGATFDGAHVAWADFENATGLTPAMMKKACVEAESSADVAANQPKGTQGIAIPRCPK